MINRNRFPTPNRAVHNSVINALQEALLNKGMTMTVDVMKTRIRQFVTQYMVSQNIISELDL